MWTEPAELLLVANSARAMAESAVRGGFGVRVLDGFCDEDTRALGACTRVPMAGWGLDPAGVRAGIERSAAGGVELGLVYGAGLESSPEVLTGLPAGMRLMGNDPWVLDLLGDPLRHFGLLEDLGIPHPETRLAPPPAGAPAPWLLKACGASGGQGVSPWRDGCARPATPHYFQRRLDGDPMSVLFIADGKELAIIGFNHLMVADGGARRPYLYGGAIGQATLAAAVRQTVAGWAEALVRGLGLRGINNLDFILHQGHVWLLELNARPSATLNLYEGQCDGGWIGHHVRACLGALPGSPVRPDALVRGHQVVYAPLGLRIPAGLTWPHWCRDRPPAGTAIPRGAPLCTVLADGAEAEQVRALLAARANTLLARIGNCHAGAPGSPRIESVEYCSARGEPAKPASPG